MTRRESDREDVYKRQEDGKPSEKFPKGYTVGWFIYADGYHQNENEIDITKPVSYTHLPPVLSDTLRMSKFDLTPREEMPKISP